MSSLMHQSTVSACLVYFSIGFSVAISYTRSPPGIAPPPSQPYTNDPVVLKPVYHYPNAYEQEPHKFWYENKPHPHRHGDQPDHDKRHQHFAKYGDNEQFDNFITDPPGVGLNGQEKLSHHSNPASRDSKEGEGVDSFDAAVIRNPPSVVDKDLSPSPNDFFKSPPGMQPEPFPELSNSSDSSSSSSGYGGYDGGGIGVAHGSGSGQGTEGASDGAPQAKIIDPEENDQQTGSTNGNNGQLRGPDDKSSKNSGFIKQNGPEENDQQSRSRNVGLGEYGNSPKHPSQSESSSGSGLSTPCCPCCGGANGQGNGYQNGFSGGCGFPYCGPPKIFGTPPNCCAQAPLPCCLRLPNCCLPQLPCCPRIQIPCCPSQPVCCQPLSPCGVCRSSVHMALRTKRTGCLPCGKRKRRDVESEEMHARTKRMGCIPCLHKKRAKRQTSCQKCSIFGAQLVSRVKRSFSCNTCGTKFERVKRQAEIADFYRGQTSQSRCVQCPGFSQSYFPSLFQSYKKFKKVVKRDAGDSGYDPIFQCKKSCCDYNKCVRSKPLKSNNDNSESTYLPPISSLGKSESAMLDVDLNEFDSSKWNKKKAELQEEEQEFLETSTSEPQRN